MAGAKMTWSENGWSENGGAKTAREITVERFRLPAPWKHRYKMC